VVRQPEGVGKNHVTAGSEVHVEPALICRALRRPEYM
jgi:hypothetical protein